MAADFYECEACGVDLDDDDGWQDEFGVLFCEACSYEEGDR